jgi:hypothetical protein
VPRCKIGGGIRLSAVPNLDQNIAFYLEKPKIILI